MNIFELDSKNRVIDDLTKGPFDYSITNIRADIKPRTIYNHNFPKRDSNPQNQNRYTIRLIKATLPYDPSLLLQRRIYLAVSFSNNNNINTIITNDSELTDHLFPMTIDKIQYDAANNPVWIDYECKCTQLLAINNFSSDIHVKFTKNDGTLPFIIPELNLQDDNRQTCVTLEITPVMYDAKLDKTEFIPPL